MLIIVAPGLVSLGVGACSIKDDLVWRFSATIILALNYTYFGAYAYWRAVFAVPSSQGGTAGRYSGSSNSVFRARSSHA